MPLTLVTGPANAAKAGEVLGGLRSRLDDEPILVVPAFGDVEHAQRELAERGAVFGASVLRFDRLFGEIARRAGHSGRVASDVQRELIVEDAVRRARLDLLSKSAAQPGFVRAAARFVAELGRSMVEPARFTRALRDWAGDGPRRQYAEEVAAIYRGYRAGLDAAGLADPELFAWRALDALRLAPESWGATPLFVYGFDDFNPLQRDALETIAGPCGADVSVSLPFEPGRAAFKAVASAHQELLAAGAREKALPPLEDHYAAESRAPLHHVERHLFEDDSGQPCVEAGDAIAFHVAGGQRAEIELVGARLLELLRAGVEPGDIAVVLRRPGDYSSLLEQVFGAYAIPFSLDRRVALGHTGLGRGLLALVRCGALIEEASADDLLAWLRTPGLLDRPELADRLESKVRREGAHSAEDARRLWESERWTLGELDRLRAARADAPAFLTELERQLTRLFTGPYHRRAPVLSGAELDDPRVFVAARKALGELRAVVEADPRTRLDPKRVLTRARRSRGPPGRVAAARPRSGRRAGGDPRAALRRRLRVRAAGAGVPEGRHARALPARRGPSRDRPGERPGAAGARGPPRPRALPVLRLLLARRAPAGALLRARATRRATPSRSPSSWRTCATCWRRSRTSAGGRCRRSPGGPRRLPRPPSSSARSPRPVRALEQPAPRNLTARRCWSTWQRATRSPPALSRTSPTARSSGW